jgi:periplasmic protein TonB
MLILNHSLSLLITLLLHLVIIMHIAKIANKPKELVTATLDISAVALNLTDTPTEPPSEAPPSQNESQPPPPEQVPEKSFEPQLKPPQSIRTRPAPPVSALPEPATITIPKRAPEPPAHNPLEMPPPKVEVPRPDFPPPEMPATEEHTKTPPAPASTEPSQVAAKPGGAAAARIDRPPQPRQSIKPKYPSGARRRGEEGSVILNVTISATGTAQQVEIVESSGFKELDEAARQAVSKARFTPGRISDKNVESQVSLTIIFKLR